MWVIKWLPRHPLTLTTAPLSPSPHLAGEFSDYWKQNWCRAGLTLGRCSFGLRTKGDVSSVELLGRKFTAAFPQRTPTIGLWRQTLFTPRHNMDNRAQGVQHS